MLHVFLLGGFRLQFGDEVVTTLTVPRLQSLLAYLAVHRQEPQLRQHLAFFFWPDSTETQARANFRRALYDLRQAWPDVEHYLHIHTQWIQWRPDVAFKLDIQEFEDRLVKAAPLIRNRHLEQAIALLEAAVELYRGPLLPECYDHWVLAHRDELALRFAQALAQLTDLLEEQRDFDTALPYAQRLLRHDPLHETTYQRLMHLHALHGDRASHARSTPGTVVPEVRDAIVRTPRRLDPASLCRGEHRRVI